MISEFENNRSLPRPLSLPPSTFHKYLHPRFPSPPHPRRKHNLGMETNFTAWSRRAVGRGALPKFLVLTVLLCTVLVWTAGSLYRRGETMVMPSPPAITNVAPPKPPPPPPPPPPKPPTYTYKPKPYPDHFWGVDVTPNHLRGEGDRNRTQIGREKASLVMLVRYVGDTHATQARNCVGGGLTHTVCATGIKS